MINLNESMGPDRDRTRDVTFGLWHTIPPEFQLAFHIYYVKYEITLSAKELVGTRGGGEEGGNDVLKIFFYFLYV